MYLFNWAGVLVVGNELSERIHLFLFCIFFVQMAFNGSALRADLSKVIAKELYDHHGDSEVDFNTFENENIVDEQPAIAQQLSEELHRFISSQYHH